MQSVKELDALCSSDRNRATTQKCRQTLESGGKPQTAANKETGPLSYNCLQTQIICMNLGAYSSQIIHKRTQPHGLLYLSLQRLSWVEFEPTGHT